MADKLEERLAHLEGKGVAHDAILAVLVEAVRQPAAMAKVRKIASDAIEAQYKNRITAHGHLVLQTAMEFVDAICGPVDQEPKRDA